MISNALLLIFVFLAGFDTLLPVVSGNMTAFTSRDLLIGGHLTLKEIVLLLHALLNLRYVFDLLERPRPAAFVWSCHWLLVLGVASSLVNGYPEDVPQAFRFLLAAYFAVAVSAYVRRRGMGRLVVALSLGVLASGGINLYYTFTTPRAFLGFLPLLWGQNGPGGYAGFFVGLSFPLFLLMDGVWAKRLLKLTVALSVFITLISYSKLGMIMAALGLLAWSWQWLVGRRRGRLLRFGMVGILLLFAGGFTPATLVEQLQAVYRYKFQDAFDESDMTRAFYYVATAEVAVKYPLGASFTGTGAAFDDTWAGRTGRLPITDDIRGVNPHNSFLAFLAADGLLGLLPCIWLFLFWSRAISRALFVSSRQSFAIWALLVGSCVVFSNTLPGFFEVFFLHAIVLLIYLGAQCRSMASGVDGRVSLYEQVR